MRLLLILGSPRRAGKKVRGRQLTVELCGYERERHKLACSLSEIHQIDFSQPKQTHNC